MRPNKLQRKKLHHPLLSVAVRQHRGICDSSHRVDADISQGKGWVLCFSAEMASLWKHRLESCELGVCSQSPLFAHIPF